MKMQIDITSRTQAELMLDFYTYRLNKITDDLNKMRVEAENAAKMVDTLKGFISSFEDDSAPRIRPVQSILSLPGDEEIYSFKFTWEKKIKFILKKHGPLTTSEIVDKLMTIYEPEYGDRQKAIRSVSAILSLNTGVNNIFIKTTNEANQYVYDINKNAT